MTETDESRDASDEVFDAATCTPIEYERRSQTQTQAQSEDIRCIDAELDNTWQAHLVGLQYVAASLYESATSALVEPFAIDLETRRYYIARVQQMAADVARAERILRGVA